MGLYGFSILFFVSLIVCFNNDVTFLLFLFAWLTPLVLLPAFTSEIASLRKPRFIPSKQTDPRVSPSAQAVQKAEAWDGKCQKLALCFLRRPQEALQATSFASKAFWPHTHVTRHSHTHVFPLALKPQIVCEWFILCFF